MVHSTKRIIMKELIVMLNDLCEKYGITEEDITPVAQKIGQLVGPELAAEIQGMGEQPEGEEEEGVEFADLAPEEDA